MTSEIRKAALDAVLERIHLEGYQNYNGFARQASVWFAERNPSEFVRCEFVDEMQSRTDFFQFNEVSDREWFLGAVFDDVVSALDAVPKLESAQLFVDEIDSFSRVHGVESENLEVDLPLNIPESEVKRYLREIIGEPFKQVDWGGERNDLFSNKVVVGGQRVDTAFMLKGPSVGGEMHISDAGKRGDQVQRLFESPADLFVIQFNGKLEDRLIQHIKQEARVSGAKMYCIMDGTDTARLLTAYGLI